MKSSADHEQMKFFSCSRRNYETWNLLLWLFFVGRARHKKMLQAREWRIIEGFMKQKKKKLWDMRNWIHFKSTSRLRNFFITFSLITLSRKKSFANTFEKSRVICFSLIFSLWNWQQATQQKLNPLRARHDFRQRENTFQVYPKKSSDRKYFRVWIAGTFANSWKGIFIA